MKHKQLQLNNVILGAIRPVEIDKKIMVVILNSVFILKNPNLKIIKVVVEIYANLTSIFHEFFIDSIKKNPSE